MYRNLFYLFCKNVSLHKYTWATANRPGQAKAVQSPSNPAVRGRSYTTGRTNFLLTISRLLFPREQNLTSKCREWIFSILAKYHSLSPANRATHFPPVTGFQPELVDDRPPPRVWVRTIRFKSSFSSISSNCPSPFMKGWCFRPPSNHRDGRGICCPRRLLFLSMIIVP